MTNDAALEHRVIRGYRHDGTLVVGNSAFSIKSLADACDAELLNAGVKYPGISRPPFFRTGSPYGKAIRALASRNNVSEIAIPKDMDASYLPSPYACGFTLKSIERGTLIWARVFGLDPRAHYANARHLLWERHDHPHPTGDQQ